ncbi:hypothetical protein [Psychroserpens jangbogonensis]|uniref:hypothetical protein n=1 Tax=Psychroserpens jangbogonensis TaxID=1484460 RepID=UPI00053F0918|nr:hypothetical protein [Psychroserpens jangbogonensis]
MGKIQVGFLVSYDFNLLKNAIPRVYKDADTIFLAIDKNRMTWNGAPFTIDDSFFEWIKAFDTDGKIVIYEDDFYVPELSTMECEVRERKMLSDKMGIGNWLVQLDADEYFIDFKSFVDFLKSKKHLLKNPEKTPVEVSPFLVNIYKKLEGGVLVVDKATKIRAATNYPDYKVGRKTKHKTVYHNSLILHECLSRTREELEFKLDNWGHDVDINKKEFLEKWESVNETNYNTMQDFFYLEPSSWKNLKYLKGITVEELSKSVKDEGMYHSALYVFFKNFGQSFKYLFK